MVEPLEDTSGRLAIALPFEYPEPNVDPELLTLE